jgi:formamidopyrimidine-DNA glycosylase
MPELPEVESIVRDLKGPLDNRTVERARLTRRDLYRTGSGTLGSIAGSKITRVERFGKTILFRLEPAKALVIHLGMTGNITLSDDDETLPRRKHRHAVIHTCGGPRLDYVDPRRFGFFWIGPLDGLGERLGIGPDPFEISAPALKRIFEKRSAPVKSLLMNQRLISGVGNIYADEILFRALIHPLTPGGLTTGRVGDLLREARVVLRRAIRHGGTTLRDYRRADGSTGRFRRRLAVYGREGEPCIRCGAAIQRIVANARSTHFCPNCQQL